MATLSTTAWVLHDLGLAAGFGGNLFGQLALNPAVKVIDSKEQRSKVSHAAWDRYKTVNAIALAATAGTWLIGRAALSGREVGQTSRELTLVKDVLVLGAFTTGVGALVTGTLLDNELTRPVPIESGHYAAPETPPRVARLQKIVNVVGALNVAFEAGVLALTTVLAMKAGKSSKWSLVSQLLP
ncbi:MAG TPA: hypothetical protein VFQ61_35775 [Polyangiaceae bacterium]|nr:hypothetical protein [Polyangiaceae bacterium]